MANDGRATFALDGDPAGFQRGVQVALRSLDALKRGFTGVSSVTTTLTSSLTGFQGALAAIGGAGIGLLVKQSFDFASQIVDTSTRIGVSTTALQELSHAAKQSGASIEELHTGLRNLNRHLAEAAAGDESAIRLFQDLGISVRDAAGNTRNAGDVMGDFAEKIKNTASPAERTRLAMEAFGRSGAQLIPMLAEGRAGLEAMRKEAHRFGLVLDVDLLEQAEKAGDALERLAGTIKMKLTQAIIGAGPAVEGLATLLAEQLARLGPAIEAMLPSRLQGVEALKAQIADVDSRILQMQASMENRNALQLVLGTNHEAMLATLTKTRLELTDLLNLKVKLAAQPKANLGGGGDASAQGLQGLQALTDKVRSAALELALPDAVTRSIVDFGMKADELGAKFPALAERARELSKAFAEIKTTATDAAAAAGAKGLGVDNSIFAGFEEIRKLKADTDAFASGIKRMAQEGVAAKDLFPTIAQGAQGLDAKMAELTEKYKDQPAVLERLKQSMGGLSFGGLQRELDAVARGLQGVKQGSVTMIDTAEGLNSTFTPAMRNAGFAVSDLGEMLLDGIPAAAGRAGSSFITLMGQLNIFGLTVDQVDAKVRQLQADLIRFYSYQATVAAGTGS